MNRVIDRAWIMVVFLVILALGTGAFLVEYCIYSGDWVVAPGSPHVYNKSNLGCGVITDRDGVLLLDTTDGRAYSEDIQIRQSTLHWIGDRKGYIDARALSGYAKEMTGYDTFNGVYTYGCNAGQARLTLSARVQTAALQAMAGHRGTLAVYNYQTGEILCAVTTPTFDPDNVPDLSDAGQYEGVYLNRFLQSTYPPGSIFKIVTTAAALECVPDIENMTFTCTGRYDFGVDRVTCEKAHGTSDLKTAMARSCNCAYAQIAQLIGRENMMECAMRYGIRDSLTFDGVTTAAGNFDVSRAAPVELAWGCIGQYTDLVNPARYLAFLGTVAGGGSGAEPYLVSRITVGDETTYTARVRMSEQVMEPETARILKEFMRNNVQSVYGAGHFPGLTVCAKSGTSELGGGKRPNAMFAGFVDDAQYPLAFIVVVENGGYGSSVCVPILAPVLAECKALLDGN